MGIGFYPRLALDGMRKNKRLYLPYIITGACMVMMCYILAFLCRNPYIGALKGGGSLQGIMNLGMYVMIIFSLIFLFYTNSFLLKRRTREFGLYHVLGMGKRNLAGIIAWEVFFSWLAALIVGLAFGIGFSKLAEMALSRLMGGVAGYGFYICSYAIRNTVLWFAFIFGVIMLVSIARVGKSSAVSLLKSESAGEKPPKANWILGLAGVVILAAAYVIAVTVENPIDAIFYFFVAVIMVIVATFLLMICSSVLLCRVLQKNKDYYYRTDRFVSVSSMAFRMKRNGAGLASICIIITMVLVTISSTASLWFGSEDSLRRRYPGEVNMDVYLEGPEFLDRSNTAKYSAVVADAIASRGGKAVFLSDVGYINVTGKDSSEGVICDSAAMDSVMTFGELRDYFFITGEDYLRLTADGSDSSAAAIIKGMIPSLAPGNCIVLYRGGSWTGDTLKFAGGKEVKVLVSARSSLDIADVTSDIFSMAIVIVSSPEDAARMLEGTARDCYNVRWSCSADTGLDEEGQKAVGKDLVGKSLAERLGGKDGNYPGLMGYFVNTRAANRDDFLGSNGGLFFLGIMLSVIFTLAAVLIIYYKQLSEGYEDSARFDIMQKVGMTSEEIRKSINSQLLTVFLAPLLFAGLHLGFAFPMIKKLLLLFGLNNTGLFLGTTGISFAVFGILYFIVYKITSNTYFRIVRRF